MTEATSSEALVRAWAARLLGDAAQGSHRPFDFGRRWRLHAHSSFRNMLFNGLTSAMIAKVKSLLEESFAHCHNYLSAWRPRIGLGNKIGGTGADAPVDAGMPALAQRTGVWQIITD